MRRRRKRKLLTEAEDIGIYKHLKSNFDDKINIYRVTFAAK